MKEDPYYLGNRDYPPIQITFKTHERTITQEVPWDAGPDEILRAVHAAMVGMTYMDHTVVHAMRDYAEPFIELYDKSEQAEQELEHTKVVLHDAEERIHKLEQKYLERKTQVAQLRGELAVLKGEPITTEEPKDPE